MKYIEATFTITDHEGNAITDTLMLQTIKDILCEYAGEAGFEAFEEQADGIVGYVQKQMFNEDILCQNINALPFDDVKVAYNLRDVEDKNWNETWEEQGFEPITIEGKCVIHDTIHPAHTEGKDITDVVIDTKQAFGTGSHETTHMIIKELFEMDLKGKSVLDCGCGTGILSIISSINGAKDITGYDIDEWSVENTKHNCILNNVANVNVLHGDSTVISPLKKKFDVVIANINRNILLADMPAFRQAMNDNGVLILSGFYTDDAQTLIDKAESMGLKEAKRDSENDWCMLKFTRIDG